MFIKLSQKKFIRPFSYYNATLRKILVGEEAAILQ